MECERLHFREWGKKSPLEKQDKYCRERDLPMFVFDKCWSCGKQIEDTDSEHITGCSFCGRSFCE